MKVKELKNHDDSTYKQIKDYSNTIKMLGVRLKKIECAKESVMDMKILKEKLGEKRHVSNCNIKLFEISETEKFHRQIYEEAVQRKKEAKLHMISNNKISKLICFIVFLKQKITFKFNWKHI